MSYAKRLISLATLTCLAAFGGTSVKAQEIKTVFVIAMENHNWTQPANQFTGGIQQIYQNPNAPFINSLVNGTAVAVIDGSEVNMPASCLRHRLSQRSFHSQRQQSRHSSVRAKLSLG
jgi:hypothetical protein